MKGKGHRNISTNLGVERGIFENLKRLIAVDDNVVWDPIISGFCLTDGYCIQSGKSEISDYYGEPIFLTPEHVDKLFAMATAKQKSAPRRFFYRNK